MCFFKTEIKRVMLFIRLNVLQDQYIYIHECMKDALKRGIMLKPSVYQHDELPGLAFAQDYKLLLSR